MNILYLQNIIASWAQRLPFPVRVYLFGSRARGNPTAESDLDIAVEILCDDLDRNSKRNKVFDVENTLYNLLHEATGLPVHVVFYDGNPNTQKGQNITKKGHILYPLTEHE